jgi:hypothetical protein
MSVESRMHGIRVMTSNLTFPNMRTVPMLSSLNSSFRRALLEYLDEKNGTKRVEEFKSPIGETNRVEGSKVEITSEEIPVVVEEMTRILKGMEANVDTIKKMIDETSKTLDLAKEALGS